MSKITDKNYIIIQSFMVSDLGLKGNELLLYAIIFGFSQTAEQAFHGSLSYLESRINGTRPTVIACLKSLVKKGLIKKEEQTTNGVKLCSYRVLNNLTDDEEALQEAVKEFDEGSKNSLRGAVKKINGGSKNSLQEAVKNFNESSKETLHNNKYENKIDNKVDNKINNTVVENDNAEKYDMKIITEIIDYLNEKAHKNYKANSKTTKKHVNARLNEGYTLSDFKQVIDNRCATWLKTDMEQYLRPETLFGSKFENYLNAPAPKRRGSDGRLLGEKSNGWEFVFGDD